MSACPGQRAGNTLHPQEHGLAKPGTGSWITSTSCAALQHRISATVSTVAAITVFNNIVDITVVATLVTANNIIRRLHDFRGGVQDFRPPAHTARRARHEPEPDTEHPTAVWPKC